MTHGPSRPWAARRGVATVFGVLSACGAALIAPSTVPAEAPPAPRASPDGENPFTDAALTGWFETADGNRRWTVEGLCDAEDGSMYRIRLTPPKPGNYRYSVVYR